MGIYAIFHFVIPEVICYKMATMLSMQKIDVSLSSNHIKAKQCQVERPLVYLICRWRWLPRYWPGTNHRKFNWCGRLLQSRILPSQTKLAQYIISSPRSKLTSHIESRPYQQGRLMSKSWQQPLKQQSCQWMTCQIYKIRLNKITV